MTSKYLSILLVLALCSCAQSCNTEDDEPEFSSSNSSSSDDDASSDSEKGYDDDGTGDDITNSEFSKTIIITYDGSSVSIEGKADSVSVVATDADVVVTSAAEEIEYILRGSSTNGSLKVYSDYKYKLTLDNLSLASQTGAAINNQSKKKLFISLPAGTSNSLSDATTYTRITDGEDLKACLFSEGQLIFCGSGELSVKGNYKHAICSDDYVAVSEDAVLTVSGSVKDGIHANDYVAIYGGITNITTSGSDGIDVDAGYFLISGGYLSVSTSAAAAKAVKAAGNVWVKGGTMSLATSGAPEYDSSDADYKCANCLTSDSSIYVSGGILYAACSGVGAKAIKSDHNIEITDGTVTAIAKGSSGNSGSAKGMKATENIIISGGSVYAYSASHEGIESKGELTISGGIVEVEAADDGINSGSTMTLSGGQIYSHSTGNDGIDSNGNLIISGGTVIAYGTTDPECGLDANDEENYHLYITGGTVFSLGGSNISYPYSTTGSQAYVTLSGSAANVALKDASGNLILAWDYSAYATLASSSSSSSTNKAGWGGNQGGGPGGNQGGGNQGGMGGGSLTFLISTPSMTSGSTYTLYSGVTVSASDLFHGLSTSATVSGGSSSSSATAATSSSSSSRW